MSTSAIACRECGHLIAKRHHTGDVKTEVGIRTVVKPDGRILALCPCGRRQAIYTKAQPRAA